MAQAIIPLTTQNVKNDQSNVTEMSAEKNVLFKWLIRSPEVCEYESYYE